MDLTRRIHQIKPSPTLSLDTKTKALKASGVDVVNFGVGEPDFNTPAHIKTAGIKAIEDNFTRYTPAGGIPELKEAIAAKFERDNQLSYDPDQIVVSCGGKHTLYNLAQVLFTEGDEVIIPAPYWVSYPPIVLLAGARPVIVQTQESNDFKITPDELQDAITPSTKAMILNSPSNPTGAVYTREELTALGEVVLRHGLLIISDDIYEKFIYEDAGFINMAMLAPELKERTMIAHGLAKTYAMTGWRIGFLAGPKEVAAAVTKLQGQSTSNPCSIAQKAGVGALNGPQESVREMWTAYDQRRRYLVEALNGIDGVDCFNPKGAFYAFPNISSYFGRSGQGWTIQDSDDLAAYLLEDARVALVPGSGFGQNDCVRFSYAISLEDSQKGVSRIKESLAKLG